MTEVGTRVSARWLRLREPADAAARSDGAGADRSPGTSPGGAPAVVHDLGCGSGSMGRWLAPVLGRSAALGAPRPGPRPPGRRHGRPAPGSADGAAVTVETRQGDLTRLRPDDLAGASLVTASALLDILTADELDHLV